MIALWLGHESVKTTQIYVHAHMPLKEQALARTKDFTTKASRYRPPDKLLASSNPFDYTERPTQPQPPTGQIPDRSA